MTRELLVEIGCEDLPARYVQPLAAALAEGIVGGLGAKGVACGAARVFATPRRIAVRVAEVAERQPAQLIERKGPSLAAAFNDGRPTPAALGFARACGVGPQALKRECGHLVFRARRKGERTARLIPALFEDALKRMDMLVPKRMRWGDGDETFVRPVQWIVALFGGTLVPIERFGLISGRKTYGHRFHAPKAISLKSPADYEAALRGAKVWADFAGRRAAIRSGVEAEAARLGGRARITDDLLDEVTALVEWPVVISGCIEERFLRLPPEVVVATVETNQRYFAVFSDQLSVDGQINSESGYLKPAFITVANIESKDVAQVIAGNERVVRPRLVDALFFWEQDRKSRLEANLSKLQATTFQKDLGTVFDKVVRIDTIAIYVAQRLKTAPEISADVRVAVTLCKCDLATKVVYEFPELQGTIGGYYALADGERESVAKAVAEHYRPTQAGSPVPSTLTGRIVALADKLDTLAGIFAIGQKPTAGKDPFALRRAALGILRICIEGELDLNLHALLGTALHAQPAGDRSEVTREALWEFVLERLRGYCLDRGATAEQFEAVRASGATRPLDFERRLQALRRFAGSASASSLAAADKRARNILRQAGGHPHAELVAARLEHSAEQALARAIEAAEADLASLRARADYNAMLERLAALKAPVDAFFDGVMVMADDPVLRANRLALLARLDTLCREVADLSQLPG
ncbi:MAG: glycine--tRNA ligase subunit beta [Gammaproteobacteria bacterium]|nr:glycine--tRNA ligase subunit beta [Gammaproteobacteria bacterium]